MSLTGAAVPSLCQQMPDATIAAVVNGKLP
jgi:hypothetical protein